MSSGPYAVQFPKAMIATPALRLTLPRSAIKDIGPDSVRLAWRSFELNLPGLSSGLREAIEILTTTGASASQLEDLIRKAEGEAEVKRLRIMLDGMDRAAMLCREAGPPGNPWATLLPTSASYRFALPKPVAHDYYRLSRFVCIRRGAEGMLLESPMAHARVSVINWQAWAVIGMLAQPASAAELHAAIPGADPEHVQVLLLLLEAAEMAGRVDAGGLLPEDTRADLMPWEFHDLLFHARTRKGRHDAPIGSTNRLGQCAAVPPVLKPPMLGEKIPLDRLDSAEESPPFASVLDERRSTRRFGNAPITAKQLGEFLFRSARMMDDQPNEGPPRRPYPSAGACYELECYVAVDRCLGLEPGLYHYQPLDHALTRLAPPEGAVAELLRDAWQGSAKQGNPQVLVIIAARFGRITVKYESISYSLILKNVGVLMQTMYLTATAMGLGGCALGCGDSDVFARAANVNYLEESSVGEFLLGSR
jgi:SagB-type dehydrogenase family enzyme